MNDVLQAIGSGFRNYFNFGGYATPMEFWSWMVFQFICMFVLLAFGDGVGFGDYIGDFWGRSFGGDGGAAGLELFMAATLIPTLSLISRRLRASGRNPLYLWMWYSIALIAGCIRWGFLADSREFPAQLLLVPSFINFNPIMHPSLSILLTFSGEGHSGWVVNSLINTFFVVWMLIWVWRDAPQLNKVDGIESDSSSDEPLLVTNPAPFLPAESRQVESVPEQPRLSPTCTNCGDTSPNEATHCISCGSKLPPLLCPKCQTENISRAKFCMGCGEER